MVFGVTFERWLVDVHTGQAVWRVCIADVCWVDWDAVSAVLRTPSAFDLRLKSLHRDLPWAVLIPRTDGVVGHYITFEMSVKQLEMDLQVSYLPGMIRGGCGLVPGNSSRVCPGRNGYVPKQSTT